MDLSIQVVSTNTQRMQRLNGSLSGFPSPKKKKSERKIRMRKP